MSDDPITNLKKMIHRQQSPSKLLHRNLSLTICISFLLTASLAESVSADARLGELLGYRIGHTTTNKAPLKGGYYDEFSDIGNARWFLRVAPGDNAPKAIHSIELNVSPISREIGSIYANAFFDTEDSAKKAYFSYLRTLPAQYPEWVLSRRRPTTLSQVDEFELTNTKFELFVMYRGETGDGSHTTYVGSLPDETDRWKANKWLVRFGLTAQPGSSGNLKFEKLVKTESAELAKRSADLTGF